MSDLINRACRAAEDGMCVFPVRVSPDPLRPGKHLKEPKCTSWAKQSTDDPEQVVKFDWSQATHFGIDCEKSGIWVVDVDDRAALVKLPLTATRVQETISGGLHYIYKASGPFDQRNTTGAPYSGIDIRANGGFIVWYGLGGMIEDTIRPWPFHALIGKEKGSRNAGSGYVPGHISEGGRNNDAICAAGYFMGKFPHATIDMLMPYLMGHSFMYHTPPMKEAELRKVAISAQRWFEEATEIQPEEFFGQFDEVPDVSPPAKLCGDWLRAGSLSMLYARAGVGKTAWLAELAISVKNGTPFFGMPCEKVNRILWINGDLPIWQVRERLGHLNGVCDLWHVMFDDLMKRQEDLIARCKGYDLVIIDNRPALFDLGDANVAEAWKPLMMLLRQMCNEGTAIIVASHEGKGEGASSSFGSSAQEWNLDNNIRLSNRDPGENKEKEYLQACGKVPTRKVQWFKSRMSAPPPDREFYLVEKVDIHNPIAKRLMCEWQVFYAADGLPYVKPEKTK